MSSSESKCNLREKLFNKPSKFRVSTTTSTTTQSNALQQQQGIEIQQSKLMSIQHHHQNHQQHKPDDDDIHNDDGKISSEVNYIPPEIQLITSLRLPTAAAHRTRNTKHFDYFDENNASIKATAIAIAPPTTRMITNCSGGWGGDGTDSTGGGGNICCCCCSSDSCCFCCRRRCCRHCKCYCNQKLCDDDDRSEYDMQIKKTNIMNMKTDEKINEMNKQNHQCHQHHEHQTVPSARLVFPTTVARKPGKQDVINLRRQKQKKRSVSEPPPIEYLLMRSFNSMTTSFSFSSFYGKDLGFLPSSRTAATSSPTLPTTSSLSMPLHGCSKIDNEGDFEC